MPRFKRFQRRNIARAQMSQEESARKFTGHQEKKKAPEKNRGQIWEESLKRLGSKLPDSLQAT